MAISPEDKLKIQRMDQLEYELGWQGFVIPVAFIGINLAFLAKFMLGQGWEANAFIITLGVLGLLLLFLQLRGRKAKKEELAKIKIELKW